MYTKTTSSQWRNYDSQYPTAEAVKGTQCFFWWRTPSHTSNVFLGGAHPMFFGGIHQNVFGGSHPMFFCGGTHPMFFWDAHSPI